MNNGLAYLGGLLIVVLTALFAVPSFIDWNGYRGVFEEEASKVLGRDVRVSGNVNLRLLPAPFVRFEKVRLANLSGQTGEPFVRSDSFTMWLSLPALLRGVLEATEVTLDKPVLTLALDGQGGGNWSNISLKAGDLPFVPRDLALRSVKLNDGAVAIYNAESERIAFVDGVYGELSADGLKGPFRFKGSAKWSGEARDVKFATSEAAVDGSFGLKAIVRVDGSPNAYQVDGRVANLGTNPVFNGAWTAKFAVPGASDASAGTKPEDIPVLDFRSTATVDGIAAKFEDLTLSLENAAVPQTISGTATAQWVGVPRFDVALKSDWLDIDRLAGAGEGSASFLKLKQLAFGLMGGVAGDRSIAARIDLAQAKIGGETTGGLKIDSERRKGITRFREFRASLPGGSRLDLTGDLKEDQGKLGFIGNAYIRGTNLGRLRSWAEKSGMALDIKADGAFSLGGKLDIGGTRFSLNDASGDISGKTLSGDIAVIDDGRPRTEVTLQAAKLDTREVFPATVKVLKSEFTKALGLIPPPDEANSKSADAAASKAWPGDMRLRVIAGELADGADTYRNVDLTFEVEGSEIRLPRATFETPAGLAIELDGRIKTGNGTPDGSLSYDVVGSSRAAMVDLARRVGLQQLAGSDRFKGLKDGRLAGLIRLGLRTPSTTDVTFDGTLNGARVSGFSEFDDGLQEWRNRPSRLQLTFEAPSLTTLMETLGSGSNSLSADAAAPAQAYIVANGVIGSGAETKIEVATQALTMNFAGKTIWPDTADLKVAGEVSVKASDYTNALALAGIALPSGAGGVPAQGALEISREGGTWQLASAGLSLGTSMVKGEVKLARHPNGAPDISGQIKVDRLTVAGLLSTITNASAPKQAAVSATAPAAADQAALELEEKSIWSDGTFNFAALGGATADLDVAFNAMELSGNLVTGAGAMKVKLDKDKLALEKLTANAAGGKLASTTTFAKASNGIAFASNITLSNAQLSAFSPSAQGVADYALKAEAVAQSPGGLIAVMAGSGSAKLKDAVFPGPSAVVAPAVAERVLGGKLQNDANAIAQAIQLALATSKMDVGTKDVGIKIAGGVLKLDSVSIGSKADGVDATASVDLMPLTLNVSSQLTASVKPLPPPPIALPEWTPPAPKGPLPPVLALYSGRLDNLASVEANVDAAEMQRELAIRQVERNVQELEQSRKVDDERLRLERERRRKLEEDRVKQAAAIAAERAAKRAAERAARDAEEAKAAAETLPPVIPEANKAAPEAAPPVASQSPAPPVEAAPNAVLTPKITVEPDPAAGDAPAAATGAEGTAQIDPATGLPIEVKPQAVQRPRPAPKPPQRRTTADEVMRSLGGYP